MKLILLKKLYTNPTLFYVLMFFHVLIGGYGKYYIVLFSLLGIFAWYGTGLIMSSVIRQRKFELERLKRSWFTSSKQGNGNFTKIKEDFEL